MSIYLDKTKMNKRVFIISKIDGGGSLKYLNDIVNYYTNIEFIKIGDKKSLFKGLFFICSIILQLFT